MKNFRIIAIVILSTLLLSLCAFFIVKYTNNKSKKAPSEDSADLTNITPYEQYVVVDNNAVLLKESNKSSLKLMDLTVGSKIWMITKSEVRVEVNGVEDFWYNIKYKNNVGWIFGGYISPKDDIQSVIASKYKGYLLSLSVDDTNSVSNGLKLYKTYSSLSTSVSVNDEMFRAFRDLYDKVLEKQTFTDKEYVLLSEFASKNNAYDLYNIKDITKIENEELRNKILFLEQNGFRVPSSEGFFYIAQDGDFLLNNFSDSTSEGIKEYLTIRSKEIKEGFSEDAALIISWNELSDRIITWENYIKKYSNYFEVKEAKDLIALYLRTYLIGMNNTPAFDYENNFLNVELKKSYESFILNYPSSSYQPVVKGYYDILKRFNFKDNKRSREYLQNNKINFSSDNG